MREPRHRVRREILELTVPDEATARQLYVVVGRLHRERLTDILDRCFGSLASPEHIQRIECLEVDLGEVDADDLERDLVEKLEHALMPALGEKLREEAAAARQRGEDPELASRLELIACFARTGSLPWWAEANEPRVIEQALDLLLRRGAAELANLVRVLASEGDGHLERIVRHGSDPRLVALCQALLATRADLSEEPARLEAALRAARPGATPASSRRVSLWLGVLRAASSAESIGEAAEFWRIALRYGALAAGVPYSVLLAEVGADNTGPEALLAQLAGVSTPSANREGMPGLAAHPRVQHDRSDNDAVEPADEIYVDNAGLILLWPFLARLFERLQLLVDGRFVGPAALHRAAGLLQHLGTGDLDPPEYQLALPKVLCGMLPGARWEFGAPVDNDELQACEQLIAAALAHAPSLGELSVAGFRGSFLVRKGVLSVRDGVWLLRVEHEPYDALLELVPWRSSWIAFPWMGLPLAIEW